VDVLLPAEALGDVPGDGLALAIRIGGEIDVFFVFRGLLELLDDLALAVDDGVLGLEVVLDVDAELRLGQVDDVADRRFDRIVPAEIFAECPRLGRDSTITRFFAMCDFARSTPADPQPPLL